MKIKGIEVHKGNMEIAGYNFYPQKAYDATPKELMEMETDYLQQASVYFQQLIDYISPIDIDEEASSRLKNVSVKLGIINAILKTRKNE